MPDKEKKCALGHDIKPPTLCVNTNVGLVCSAHVDKYRNAVRMAIACLHEERGSSTYSDKALRTRTKQILLGDLSADTAIA